MSSKEGLKEVAVSFFWDLFSNNNQGGIPSDWPNLFAHRSTALNDSLNAEITEEEVKHALFSIGPLKAPGEDEIPTMFYHKSWEAFELIRRCFHIAKISEGLNATLITFILKLINPSSMKDLRPISL